MRRDRPVSSMLAQVRGTWLPVVVVALLYALGAAFGRIETITSAAISTLALFAIGAGLFVTTLRNTPVILGKLGGRAATANRRYRTLALATASGVFLTLAAGTLVTDTGALRNCTTLPLCPSPDALAQLAQAHRLVAALATVLVAVLALQTYRVRPEGDIRRMAVVAFGLMLLQNAVGALQVLVVNTPATLMATRGAHLALAAATWGLLAVVAARSLRPAATVPQAAVKPTEAAPPTRFKDYLSLTKPGVITLLIFTTLVGLYITPAGKPSLWVVFWTMVGGWLMPSGAHALNCYFDRDIDLKMGRTGRRPLPSGRIPAWHALVLGITLAVVAFAVLAVFVNIAAAVLALIGFFYYVVVYTLVLKRNSPSNIVIGGGAGAIPPLVGWAAATGGLTWGALFLFLIVFYWTPPHFWALALIRQKDYANAGVPMLPVVSGDEATKRQIMLYSIQMVVLTLLLVPLQMMGWIYLVSAVVLGALFLRDAWKVWKIGTTQLTWRLYKYSLLYLFLLFVAMLVDRLVLG